MVTLYGRILAETSAAWLFAPATRLERDPPLADAVTVPKHLATRRPSCDGLAALQMAAASWPARIGLDFFQRCADSADPSQC
jgi:hypothetical protein